MVKEKTKDRIVVVSLLLFFAIITALLIVFYNICTSTYNGVVTDNSYEKGLSYNEVIKAGKWQEEQGFKESIEIKKVSDNRYKIIFSIQDEEGKKIDLSDVMIRIFSPVTDKYDQELEMVHDHDGNYVIEVNLVEGQKDITIKTILQNHSLYFKSRVLVSNN